MRDRGRRGLAQPRREKIGAPCKNNRIYNGFTASGLSGCSGTVGAWGQLRVVAFEPGEALVEAVQLECRVLPNKKPAEGPGCGQTPQECPLVHETRYTVYRSEVVCQKLYFQEPNP